MQSTDFIPPADHNPSEGQAEQLDLPRRLNTTEIFGPDRVVLIDHRGKTYRLSITRHNRLILQV